MNEEQTRALLKKSALQTREKFTENLMMQIEARSEAQLPSNLPSLKGALVPLAAVALLLSFLLYYTNFTVLSELDVIGTADRTKLFTVLLISVVFGINYLLKMHHTSKLLLNDY